MSIAFPQIDLDKAATELNEALRDGAYIAIGLGVLGFQRAQVRRVELTKKLESRLAELGDLPASLAEQAREQAATAGKVLEGQAELVRQQIAELARILDERVEPARRQLDEKLDRLEEHLPAGARGVARTVRSAVALPEQVLRNAASLS